MSKISFVTEYGRKSKTAKDNKYETKIGIFKVLGPHLNNHVKWGTKSEIKQIMNVYGRG